MPAEADSFPAVAGGFAALFVLALILWFGVGLAPTAVLGIVVAGALILGITLLITTS